MQEKTNRTKFKNLKKFADGYVAKKDGKILVQSFHPRPGYSKVTGHTYVWRKLLPHLGYNQEFSAEKRSEIIKKLVGEGWRVIPVVLTELVNLDSLPASCLSKE